MGEHFWQERVMSGLVLPEAPESETGVVKAWARGVVMRTYLPAAADKNPMFLERRVYQGSSGKVYPLPFVDRISGEAVEREWEAVHIENEYVRLMILPELGGRIHVGLDKTNGYDFFYRQDVIKPALVGLAGPWISGGVEFNWPQHHRPSTFMRCDWEIERDADGSVTVWCGEHEPMNRMKGMHGVCLRPGSSVIELKARVYNRTELPQTFLWWANAAVRVHEQYQSFFPADVTYVADHAKRAMARFPLCDGVYYGIDYGARAGQKTAGGYAANDLSWYGNIPVPTSYMAMGSKEDFFGGYDHRAKAGVVHVADHHIAPGKKQWTWGNAEFGKAWDRNLSEDVGPYIELMAGVYTDNQPDFSWLMPGETRVWSQYWYPIREIGPVGKGNVEGAVSVSGQWSVVSGQKERRVRVGFCATREMKRVRARLVRGGEVLQEWVSDVGPGAPFVREVGSGQESEVGLGVVVLAADGREVIRYEIAAAEAKDVPAAAREPALPGEVGSVEELYWIGVHLEQYRHATRGPEAYWMEGLKREAGHVGCNVAMGWWRLRRGEFGKAAEHFRGAIGSMTKWNPNPPPAGGEAFYGLGTALRYLGLNDKAYEALAKAAWNSAWQSAAWFAMAQLASVKKEWVGALELVEKVLRVNGEHLQGRHLKALVLLKLDREAEARAVLEETVRMDRLDFSARGLNGEPLKCDLALRMDIAFDLMKAGFYYEALMTLSAGQGATFGIPMCAFPPNEPAVISGEHEFGQAPMMWYTTAFVATTLEAQGFAKDTKRAWESGKEASPDYCFPHRLEEIGILLAAINADEADAKAPYYLGNLLYDKRRREEAIGWWEKAAKLDRAFATPWRNLGIAYYNVYKDVLAAKGAYERAFKANGSDARVFYERDQLWRRAGESPERRLEEFEDHPGLVIARDDATIEWCALLNQLGQYERALELMMQRRFGPWEGGEGKVLEQWARAHVGLGRLALWHGDGKLARDMFETGLRGAENLGEAWHPLANRSELLYWAGMAARAVGDARGAETYWKAAAESAGDFREMAVCAFSEMSYFSALALKELGRHAEARGLFEAMERFARQLAEMPAKVDYFATSLPAMLLFEEDLEKRQAARAKLIEALALQGLGDKKMSRRMLGDLVRDDPNDAVAADLLRSIAWD